ncbi:hypothetical protein BX600DRAFT_529124 [Xylariales sp. PMI_506]|nr:hypothetical protein BX600DRAFT_529124 [Xylariales sp. PMI_506]
MSRYIDQVPPPSTPSQEMKLVVLSFSRTGTLGVYNACRLLGYRSYHIFEAFKNGVHDMKMFNDGLESSLYPKRGKPFTKREFDKWFPEYNVISDVPSYMASEFVAAYPKAEFLLVERDPKLLVQSWQRTTFKYTDDMNSFPFSILKYFEPLLFEMYKFCNTIVYAVTEGKGTTAEGAEALERYYKKYIESVKKQVPPSRLHVVRLEDGLGWEQLCPLLGEDIPDIPWPMRHTPEEFEEVVGKIMAPTGKRALMRFASLVAVPVIAVATYYLAFTH